MRFREGSENAPGVRVSCTFGASSDLAKPGSLLALFWEMGEEVLDPGTFAINVILHLSKKSIQVLTYSVGAL